MSQSGIIYSPEYILLEPKKYRDIKVDLFIKDKFIVLQNIEANKKINLCNHYFDSDGGLIIRIYNFLEESSSSTLFPFSKNVFALKKGEPLAEYISLKK